MTEESRPRYCTAQNRTGGPCRNAPLAGMTVCRKHGGAAPQVKAAAQSRIFEAKARQLLLVHAPTVRPVTDPLSELLRLAGEVLAFKDAVGELVGQLDDRIRFTDDKGSEQLRSEVVVYERAMDRAERTLADIVRLGIEERMAKVSEAQAAMLARVIDGVLVDLGHDPISPAVAAVVGRRLREIA